MPYRNFDDAFNSALGYAHSEIKQLEHEMDTRYEELKSDIRERQRQIDEADEEMRDIDEVRNRILDFENL